MFCTELCTPVIHKVFFNKRLTTVSTARRYGLAKTVGVIGRSLVQIEFGIADRLMASRTEEVFRVPGSI